jgi:serine protease Do
MKKTKILINILFALCLILNSINAFAHLKDYIVIVKAELHEKTRDTFLDIAEYFEEEGDEELADIFRSFAEGWHGSGFIVVDEEGNNYVITNRHVVIQSEKVDIEIETPEGKKRVFLDCPILYVDRKLDLAVIQFPDNEKVRDLGLELDFSPMPDGTEVWSAGFPGLLGRPGWQFAKGNITNERAYVPEMADPDITYIIQHSASIDPGNSGGPLLIADPESPTGYKVIGINTWGVFSRQNTFFSLPSSTIQDVLDRAKETELLVEDEQMLKEDLIKNCQILAAELGSEHPDWEKLGHYVSYSFVSESGFESFIKVLEMSSPEEREKWNESFFLYSPVETMRMAIYYLIWMRIQGSDSISNVIYESINFSDLEEVKNLEDIRTNFTVGDETVEIVWSFEYGHWLISHMVLDVEGPEIDEEVAEGQEEEKPLTIYEKRKRGMIFGVTFGTIAVAAVTIIVAVIFYRNLRTEDTY